MMGWDSRCAHAIDFQQLLGTMCKHLKCQHTKTQGGGCKTIMSTSLLCLVIDMVHSLLTWRCDHLMVNRMKKKMSVILVSQDCRSNSVVQ